MMKLCTQTQIALSKEFTDMRRDKIPTVMFPKKYEEPELYYHCKFHMGNRMVRLSDGSLRCTFCGSPEVATMIKMTVEQKEET